MSCGIWNHKRPTRASQEKKQTLLKPRLSFEERDKITYEYSDNEYAEKLRKEEAKLFEKVFKRQHGS